MKTNRTGIAQDTVFKARYVFVLCSGAQAFISLADV